MEELKCKICFSIFDDDVHAPMMFTCGHTFCNKCIVSRKDSWSCFVCGVLIPGEEAQFHVNHLALNLAKQSFKGELQISSVMTSDIEALRSRIKNIQMIHCEILRDLKDCMAELNELEGKLQNPARLMDTEEISPKMFNIIKEKVLDIENSYHRELPKFRYRVGEFKDPRSFMDQVHEAVQEGIEVYTAHYVGSKVKYGKVSVWKNHLLFHTLYLSEIENKNYVLKFEDLKSVVPFHQAFQAFLKIQCNSKGLQRYVIVNLNDHLLASQFIKLCTGELGPSYLHNRFSRGYENKSSKESSIMEVNKFNGGLNGESHPVDYVSFSLESKGVVNSTVIQGYIDGGFRAFKVLKNDSLYGIIGEVESPPCLSLLISDEDEYLCIMDSGISYKQVKGK